MCRVTIDDGPAGHDGRGVPRRHGVFLRAMRDPSGWMNPDGDTAASAGDESERNFVFVVEAGRVFLGSLTLRRSLTALAGLTLSTRTRRTIVLVAAATRRSTVAAAEELEFVPDDLETALLLSGRLVFP